MADFLSSLSSDIHYVFLG